MSDISTINVKGNEYSLKDNVARSQIYNINNSDAMYVASQLASNETFKQYSATSDGDWQNTDDFSEALIDYIGDNIKYLSANGKTITYTKGNGTTGTITTQDTTYSNATTSTAGLMSASDKAKLDNIEENATADSGDTVSWSQNTTSGTKIATITINGTATSVYAPSSSSSSDTLNTTGTSNKTGTKMYLVGGTSQSSSTVTYSNSNCYIGTDNELYSNGSLVLTTDDESNLSVSTAQRLGNSTVGSGTKPIYLNTGVATASTSTVGSSTTPVYLNSGTITACSYNVNKTVPSDAVFTDTTYSAGTGLSLSGTTINHASSVTAGNAGDSGSTRTLSHGGTFVVPYISYNATGHITGVTNKTLTLPAATTSTTASLAVGATGTTTDASVTSPYLKLINGSSVASNVQFAGGTNMTVTSDSSKVITISTSATADSAIPTSTITSLCASILV